MASLLEVGTGFHPELSGREPESDAADEDRPTSGWPVGRACIFWASQNVFLNAAILGMGKAEIRAKLDEIIGFAGIRKLINTQVQNYRWTAQPDGANY